MDASFARYRGYALMTALFIVVLIGTVILLRSEQDQERQPIVINTLVPRATPTPAVVVVDVRGAVTNPGVYKLEEGSRVQDALKIAGNALGDADTSGLNLARKLNDGEQILVPKRGDTTPTASASSTASARPASACLPYKDAGAHMNETTCVRGSVSSTYQTANTFMIYFDDANESFYAVSFNNKWDNLRNRCVEITGKITLFRGRPEIVIDKLDQLNFCR